MRARIQRFEIFINTRAQELKGFKSIRISSVELFSLLVYPPLLRTDWKFAVVVRPRRHCPPEQHHQLYSSSRSTENAPSGLALPFEIAMRGCIRLHILVQYTLCMMVERVRSRGCHVAGPNSPEWGFTQMYKKQKLT